MKCKKGFKKSGDKCVKTKKTIKQKKVKNKWISLILFFSFSFILFINNITDLFVKFGLYVPIQWITWIGLILVVVYIIWLKEAGKL